MTISQIICDMWCLILRESHLCFYLPIIYHTTVQVINILKFKPTSLHYCIKSLCHCTVHVIRIFSSLLISNYNNFSVKCLVETSNVYSALGLYRACIWEMQESSWVSALGIQGQTPILQQGLQSACNTSLETVHFRKIQKWRFSWISAWKWILSSACNCNK